MMKNISLPHVLRVRAHAMLCAAAWLLTACGTAFEPAELPKANFEYWSNKKGFTCATMAGRDYCVDDKYILAKNWTHDPTPGFLIVMPISDPSLVRCNEKYWKLNGNSSPSITIGFSDQISYQDGKLFDNAERYYQRMLKNLIIDDSNNSFTNPRQYIYFNGIKCIKHKENSLRETEMLCHDGVFGSDNPPWFFECGKDGSVPFPSCKFHLFYKNMLIVATTQKECQEYNIVIKKMIFKYIDSLEVNKEN